jgi:4-amino-4-deoxy-L-arabinose transferase-like glycosyltransferase
MTPLSAASRPTGHRSPNAIPAWLLPVIALAFSLYRAWVILHLDIDPYVDEAYYWGWAQALDWGYYSKPPLIAGLIALCGGLFGDNLLALKAPSLILYPATVLVIQQLGHTLFDERVGFWAGLAFLTMPLVSALGLFVSTDAPLLFFWALGMLLLWRTLAGGSVGGNRSGHIGGWIGIGIVAGLGLMSKYTMAAFIGSAFLALLTHPGGWRQLGRPGPWLALVVASALFAPNLWWNWQNGFPTFQHTAEITRIGGAGGEERGWNPGELLEFLGGQWASFGPLLAIGLGWALLRLHRLWADTRFRFLLMFVLPLLTLVSVQALTGRANSNWAAPIFVAGCVLTLAFLGERANERRPGPWRFAVAAVALNLVIALAAYHWPDLLRLSGKELTSRNDPYKRARGWHELAAAVRPQLAAHPDAVLVSDDRELLAQLIYGLRPARYARWQPQAHIADHYGLTAPLTPQSGDPILFVSDRANLGTIPQHFVSAEKLGEVDVAVYPKLHRRASVWLMRGFRGY